MKKIILIVFIILILILPFLVEASHNSYTGTDYDTCVTRCVEGHVQTLAAHAQCYDTCKTIVSNNQNKKTTPVVTTPPPVKKTHASMPYITWRAPYDYMKNCLGEAFVTRLNVDTSIDYCKEIYDSELSNYYLFSVASCNQDCQAEGYGDCYDYCSAINQKYRVLANKEYVNKAIDDWKKDSVKIGKIVIVPDPTCSDRIKNQGELAVDCGGPCKPCVMKTPTGPNCYDGIQNRDETGIDCGGVCKPCPTCSDEKRNQGEADVDCGGPCKACPSCSDKIRNQGEERADCGGPCKSCLPIITYEDLSKKDKHHLNMLHILLSYSLKEENKRNILLLESQILELYKEAAKKLGGDPTAYDIMAYFEQLRTDQKEMPEQEKAERMAIAERAYANLLLDDYRYKKGVEGISKKDIEDKEDQIKAQYGRVLLFDPDNIQANKALGDLYDEEGKEKEARVFYKKFLDNAAKDPGAYREIEAKLKTYRKEASDDLNLPELPTSATSRVVDAISKEITDGLDKANLALYEQKKNINIILEGATLSKERKAIWARFNEFLFSFSPEKVEQLGGVSDE